MKAKNLFHLILWSGIAVSPMAKAATVPVTSLADDGSPGTLRTAIESAASGDTLDLTTLDGSILLNFGQLTIDKDLVIAGPGPSHLAIDGQLNSRVFCVMPGAVVTFSGLAITNGYEDPFFSGVSAGGGILNELGTLTILNCWVSGNFADLGAGIFNDGGSLLFGGVTGTATLRLLNSTLSGNSTESGVGGAVLCGSFPGSSSVVIVQNSTLSGNMAWIGGAIQCSAGSTVQIDNSTLSGNVALSGLGGGIAVRGSSLAIKNTLLDGGSWGANIWLDPQQAGLVQSYGYNLSSDDGGGQLAAGGDLVNTEPLLGLLQYNGGPVPTHALMPGSPAVDAGSATDITGLPVTSDQRGVSRPQGPALDIGAFEAEQESPPPGSGHSYSWSGVLRPIESDGTSVFKAGSTIPVKFKLTGEDAGITDLVAKLCFGPTDGGVVETIHEAQCRAGSSGTNLFSYDAVSGEYCFNWSTKGLSSGTYRVFIDLGDGEVRTVDVTLK